MIEGNPSRVRALNLVGLKRAGIGDLQDGEVLRSLKQAFRLLYRSEYTFAESLEKLESLNDNDYVEHLSKFIHLSQLPGRRGLIPGRG